MAYGCTLEKLLAILHARAPAKADAIAKYRKTAEYGLLSVGLKIHCIGDGEPFSALVYALGGNMKVLEQNMYKHVLATFCLVLPPVGNASAAIMLLECIERYIDFPLLGNNQVQIQVCSPGKLTNAHAALLGMGYYFGSDRVRRYELNDFATTASNDPHYRRGKRLVVYDAGGTFENGFPWWIHKVHRKTRVRTVKVKRKYPFANRTDVLVRGCSPIDIRNINLIASLLIHAQYGGFWSGHGLRFKSTMLDLFDAHILRDLVEVSWVTATDGISQDDQAFKDALHAIVAYAFDESRRVKKYGLFSWMQKRAPCGILGEMRKILEKHREEIVEQCNAINEKGIIR